MVVRLPVPGSDDGEWGDLLNEFLEVAHNDDGTLKNIGVLAAKANDNAVLHSANNLTELTSMPTARGNLGLGSVATKDVPISGDALSSQVVLGSDTRLAAAGTAVQSVNSQSGSDITLDSTDIGLGSVDNTADIDKPVSGAQQTALNAKVSKAGDTMTGDLLFTKGSDVTLGTTDAHGINFQTQGATAMSVRSDGSIGVGSTNNYGLMTLHGTIATDSEGDIFHQYDGGSGVTYPVFARYWDNNGTFQSSTYLFGNGTHSHIGLEKPGSATLESVRIRSATTELTGDVTVGGNLAVNGVITGMALHPVVTVTLTPLGTNGVVVRRDVPLYRKSDGTWYASETLISLPFTATGGVAQLGFEPAQVPFSPYFIEIISCGMTVASLDGTQVCTVSSAGAIEVADGFDVGYDPVVWGSATTVGSQLSLVSGTESIQTNTSNTFQVSAWFYATIIFDDGSSHMSN